MEKKMEVFAVGKWNGMTFTRADLQGIAEAFVALGDNHRVPVKLGHNKAQKVTDGQPALGWVNGLSVEGDKLVADVQDIPEIVFKAMEKKLYRNVSIELDFDVTYKDQHFPAVLSGVALLGADIPAVNTLKDLTHFLSRDAAFRVGRRAAFSAIAGVKQGDKKMDDELKELMAKVAELSAKQAEFTVSIAQLTAENTQLKAEKSSADAAAKAAKEAAFAVAAAKKRGEVFAVLEEGVKASLITPAQREQFSKLLKLNEDASVEVLNIDDVKALVTGGKKHDFGRKDTSRSGELEGEKDTRLPDEILADECAVLVSKKEASDMFAAQTLVFSRNPNLARAYLNQNGGVQ